MPRSPTDIRYRAEGAHLWSPALVEMSSRGLAEPKFDADRPPIKRHFLPRIAAQTSRKGTLDCYNSEIPLKTNNFRNLASGNLWEAPVEMVHSDFERQAEAREQPSGSRESLEMLHRLLFLIEYPASPGDKWREHKGYLDLFFTRHGGLHLLLMLLNAHYNKPPAGRRPGWVFSGMCDRIMISERGLRMLINDAIAQGLIEQLPVTAGLDRRCRSYKLTAPVVQAWEALMCTLNQSISGILDEFDPGALANIDYRKWDPDRPAGEQVAKLPPSHRLRRSA